MNGQSFGPFALIILAVALILIPSCCISIGENNMRDKLQKEAVSLGHAEYLIDTNGVVTFQWKKVNEK